MYPIVCIIGKSMLVCSNAVRNTGWNSENGLIITESQNDWLKLEKTTKIQPVLSHTPHVRLTMCSMPYLHISWTPPGTIFITPVFHWRFVFLQDLLQRRWENWTRNMTGSCYVFDFGYSRLQGVNLKYLRKAVLCCNGACLPFFFFILPTCLSHPRLKYC